jgi:hypothetical protein
MRERLLKRLQEIKTLGIDALATKFHKSGYGYYLEYGKTNGFKSAALSFVERIYGKEHSYYTSLLSSIDSTRPSNVEAGLEIINSIEQEISGDWLFSLKGLLAAELFADFLEMAEYLLKEGYKDPSAVIIGSVLEEHLRQLCDANKIDVDYENKGDLIPKKADRLNSDLAKEGVYTKLDQKAVTMWLDLRNRAAHGKYTEYSIEQVENMYSGVAEFMSKTTIRV